MSLKQQFETILTSGSHRLMPPRDDAEIARVEAELERLPQDMREILSICNGVELFIFAGPQVTLFGIEHEVDKFIWYSGYFIEPATRIWRAEHGRSDEWTFAMTSYGGLIVVTPERVFEFDCGSETGNWPTLSKWLEHIVAEAAVVAAELETGRLARPDTMV